MTEVEFEKEVAELLARMREVFAQGYGFHFPVGTRSHAWIIPSTVVLPSPRNGFLLALEGKGSLFIDSPDWGDKFTLVKAGIPYATGEILARVIDGLIKPATGPDGPADAAMPHNEVKRIGHVR